MSDKITTLHLKNDPTTNVYPNVKIENIPLDESVTRDGENLVKTKTIYDFAHLNFLSLDGGTMDGIITINGIGIPEKTILGDGVEVVEESNPAEPVTHYGCGYIRQDDDEDSSTKYEYNFPKKSGTFALESILNLEVKTENFESFFTKTIDEDGNFNFDLVNDIPNGLYIYKPDSSHLSNFNFLRQILLIVLGHALDSHYNDYLNSIAPIPSDGSFTTSIEFLRNNQDNQYYIYVIGSIIYIDTYWEH